MEIAACNGTDIFSVKSRNGTLLEQNAMLVERCTPVCSRLYSCVSFDGPVRDEGCLTGLDVYLTYTKCNQVLCHAWPVTVRNYNAHFFLVFVKRKPRHVETCITYKWQILRASCKPLYLYFGINPLKPKRRPLYLKTQSVPRCKHFLSRL